MTMTNDNPKPMGCSNSKSKREVYSNAILPQETRKISNNLKPLKKEEQNNPQSLQKERNHKDQIRNK